MDELQMVGSAVLLCTDKMTDAELAAMNLCIQWGSDPRPVMGYEKAGPLFTTEVAGVPQAHELTKQAMAAIVMQRLAGGSQDGTQDIDTPG